MIHLYINGAEVHLPEDISIDYYVYNPFFGRRGEYTYDIDINLKDPANAKVYGHLHRWNVAQRPLNRKAELFDNAKLLISGTEVVLSVEGDVAKIQIVSGNSELNYLSANENVRLKDLDMGAIAVLDTDVALASLYGDVGTFDFVCPPIARTQKMFGTGWFSDGAPNWKKFYNNLLRPGHNEGDPTHPRKDFNLSFHSTPNLRAQPYLAAIVEKVVTAMGYRVTDNVLRRHGIFSKVYIVNSKETLNYNEMLPNWTVNDFLDEVEHLCNVVFLVNPLQKTCSIVNVNDFYQGAASEFLSEGVVQDYHERTYSDEAAADNVNYDNLAYQLPDSAWFKYGCLPDGVVEQCDIINWADRGAAQDNVGKMVIVYMADSDTYFVARKWETGTTAGGTKSYWQPINFLKNVADASSKEQMTFRIVPAEIIGLSLDGYYWKGYDSGGSNVAVQPMTLLPYAADQGYVEDGEADLNSMIEGGVKEESVADTMPVAIYRGVAKCFWSTTQASAYPDRVKGLKFPMSSVTNVYVIFSAADGGSYHFWLNDGLDLRLETLKKKVYKGNYSIDTMTERKAFFYTDEILDPKKVFVVKNRRLYCKYLLYKITAQGLKREVEGVFYDM